ncbi:hypothetical protein OV203_02445 [Nannocystis sp. ILAH1]|uniref:hypothetical protein n=1 Tax=Nannocystis sp. ILAH1 TaxID=2996789 RepID=UPI00226E13B3|nr:hypothetical protein [Nannocystis sp. ILAH1]MCY0985971.1 hypothetical protein [Nannocystis sp. ILAH1]
MLRGLRVPTHRVDAPGVYILPHDRAWDFERIKTERARLAELALDRLKADTVDRLTIEHGRRLSDEERIAVAASCKLTVEERDAAEARHPVPRYLDGDTRFDPQAVDQSPAGPTHALAYLLPGSEPTLFHLRRVGYLDRMRIEATSDPAARWAAWVKAGVEAIVCGADTLWRASEEERHLTDAWLESIASAEGGAFVNLIHIAGAVSKYSAPLKDDEKKA